MHRITIGAVATGVASPPRMASHERKFAIKVGDILLDVLSEAFQDWVSVVNLLYWYSTDGSVEFVCEMCILLPGAQTADRLVYRRPFDGTLMLDPNVMVKEIRNGGEDGLLQLGINTPGMADAYLEAAIEVTR